MLEFLEKNRRRGPASRRLSIRQHVSVVLPPLLGAMLVTGAWCVFHKRLHIQMSKDVMEVVAFAIVLQAAIFAIAAAMVLTGTWDRVRSLSQHVLNRDERAFMAIRDEKMPISMHFVLAASGLSVLILLSAAHYKWTAEGAIVVFLSWFVVLLYYRVVRFLQNITSSPWIANRIPERWHKQDVDRFFGTGYIESPEADAPQRAAQGHSADIRPANSIESSRPS